MCIDKIISIENRQQIQKVKIFAPSFTLVTSGIWPFLL